MILVCCRKLREVFDSFDANQTGEISLTSVVDAYQRLTNKTIDLRSLCDYLSTKRADAAHLRISFDQFCVLVAEFGVDDVGVEPFATSGDGNDSRLFARLATFQTKLTNTFINCIGTTFIAY